MNKLLFGLKLTWPRMIMFAVVSAVVVAALAINPVTRETSLAMPADNVEIWLIIGIILSYNATSGKDAMAKVFAFFAISQPLIYLCEVPFVEDGFGIFRYYAFWAAFAVATIPLALWAYQIKLKNAAGLVAGVLAVASLAYIGSYYVPTVVTQFPRFLLAAVFCYASAACLAFALIPKALVRAIAGVVAAATIAGAQFTNSYFSSHIPDCLYFWMRATPGRWLGRKAFSPR